MAVTGCLGLLDRDRRGGDFRFTRHGGFGFRGGGLSGGRCGPRRTQDVMSDRLRDRRRHPNRVVLHERRRRLRQRSAKDARPALLGDNRNQAEPHRRNQAKDADRGAAQSHQHAVADDVGRHECPEGRLSKLEGHLYDHRPRHPTTEGHDAKTPLLPRRFVEAIAAPVRFMWL
jgi:hypothetical protein